MNSGSYGSAIFSFLISGLFVLAAASRFAKKIFIASAADTSLSLIHIWLRYLLLSYFRAVCRGVPDYLLQIEKPDAKRKPARRIFFHLINCQSNLIYPTIYS